MHPLFDHFGRRGRQLVLPGRHPGEPDRLAWVHSLCAYAVCCLPATAGCVYGCNRIGQYQSEDGDFVDHDSDEDEDLSVNSVLADQQGEDDLARTYHFAYCLPSVNGTTDLWTDRIKQFQQKLKCTICGLSDHNSKSYRIPIQCRANEDDEWADFRKTHREMGPDDACTQALHVGCAMWGIGSDMSRRVYYYPGNKDKLYPEPVTEVYCSAHALDINSAQSKPREPKPSTKPPPPEERRLKGRPPATVIRPPTENAATVARRTSESSSSDKPHAQRKRADSTSVRHSDLKRVHSTTGAATKTTATTTGVGVASTSNTGRSSASASRPTKDGVTPTRARSIPDHLEGSHELSSTGRLSSHHPASDKKTSARRTSTTESDKINLMESKKVAKQHLTLTSPKIGKSTGANLSTPASESRMSTIDNNSSNIHQPLPSLLDQLPLPRKKNLSSLLPRDDAFPIGRKFGGKRGKGTKPTSRTARRDDHYGPSRIERLNESTHPAEETDKGEREFESDDLQISTGDTREREQSTTGLKSRKKRKRSVSGPSESTDDPSASVNQAEEIASGHMSHDDDADDKNEMDVSNDQDPDEATPDKPVGRWDHLFAGPHYAGIFTFGEWDTYDELNSNDIVNNDRQSRAGDL
jgi:hypothetical protein